MIDHHNDREFLVRVSVARKVGILELGTSYGYSGIWLAEAARATGGRLVTMELSERKSAYAREMSRKAGLFSLSRV